MGTKTSLEVCVVKGCGKPRKKAGKYCSMHYARYYRTGNLEIKPVSDRLLDSIVIDETGCWNATRGITKDGYSRIRINGKKTLAHRHIYEKYYGPIPNGFVVCHKCDNPSCINPDHLYAGTTKDNAIDMSSRHRNWLQRAKVQGLKFNIGKKEMPDGYEPIR
jgi:hypothetical protein